MGTLDLMLSVLTLGLAVLAFAYASWIIATRP